MGEIAKKFNMRAPRYTLRPTDNKFLRYAFQGDKENVYTTKFVDISYSGLAFITSKEHAPEVGERIKLEFPVPGKDDQVAWWAQVVRLKSHKTKRPWRTEEDEFAEEEVFVAVKFENLPEGHIETVKVGIKQKALEISRQKQIQFKADLLSFTKYYYKQILIFIVCSFLTFTTLYELSKPTDNYSKERGSQWTQRFIFFDWQKIDK